MPTVDVNGVTICYEDIGEATDPPLVLIAGLGSQLVSWPDELCRGFTDRYFRVIRFDNRDVGLSSHFDHVDVDPGAAILSLLGGEDVEVPYTLRRHGR